MFTKRDFKTYDEYVKAAIEPPKSQPKSKVDLTKKEVKNVQDDIKLTELFSDNSRSESALENDYETYKYEWLEQSPYSVYDFVEAIVNYAVKNNRVKEFISNPTLLVAEWEDESGFDEDMYLSYDEWLNEKIQDQELGDTPAQENPDILEIIDCLDMGCTKADLIDRWGYRRSDVEKAMEIYRSMGCPISKEE